MWFYTYAVYKNIKHQITMQIIMKIIPTKTANDLIYFIALEFKNPFLVINSTKFFFFLNI
jgi:hypothetical protein